MSQFLAIDVDAGGLFVAAGAVRKGAVAVSRVVALPDETGPLTAENAPALGKKLKDLLKQSGVAAAPVVFLVGRDRVLLKDVRHPPVPGSEEPAVVRFQAVKELNDSPDDFVLDYRPAGTLPDGGRKSQAAFVKKDLFAAIRTLCDVAGLKLAAVTPRAYAAAAGLRAAFAAGTEPPDAPTDAVALIFPTASAAEFAVVRGDDLLFSRPIPAAALASEASYVGEVRRNLAVVSGQVPGGVSALYLAESDAPGGGWAGRFRATLPLPVRPYDPLAGSPSADTVPPQYRGAFAATVGALRLRALPGPLPINFVTPRQPKAEPNKNRTKFLVAALAACLLLGAGFLGGMWLVEGKGKELAAIEEDKLRVDDELFQLASNAKRSEAAEEFLRYQVRLHDELYDWTDLFPDIAKTRVTVIDFNAAALPSKTERQKEDKAKDANPNYKPPVKPVGTTVFTIQATDRNTIDTFVRNLAQQRNYVGVTSSGGAMAGGTAGAGSQTFTVKAGIHSRKPDQYTRKLNVTLPKPKPKASADDPFDDFGGGGGFPGFNALPGGATP